MKIFLFRAIRGSPFSLKTPSSHLNTGFVVEICSCICTSEKHSAKELLFSCKIALFTAEMSPQSGLSAFLINDFTLFICRFWCLIKLLKNSSYSIHRACRYNHIINVIREMTDVSIWFVRIAFIWKVQNSYLN